MELKRAAVTIVAVAVTFVGLVSSTHATPTAKACAGKLLQGPQLNEDGSWGTREMCLPEFYFTFMGGTISPAEDDMAACARENLILGTIAEGEFQRMRFVPLVSKDQTQKVCAQNWFAVFIVHAK